MTFKETPSEINATDLDAVKCRLAGMPYQSHHWMPIGGGAEAYTAAGCTRCNITEYSGKDFCDTEGLAKFWITLKNRRDCI